MARPVLNDGSLVWCGEHWINALCDRGDGGPTAWFSLFCTRYSECGEGHTLQLVVPSAGISVVCSDNPDLGAWIARRFLAKSSVKPPDAPIMPAEFRRSGATHHTPMWTVEWAGHRIDAKWAITEDPVIAYGPFGPDTEFFTVLLFTMESTLALDGHTLPGRPYPRDIWEASIGGVRSSSVIALNETLIVPRRK